jgi:hypothetical protein
MNRVLNGMGPAPLSLRPMKASRKRAAGTARQGRKSENDAMLARRNIAALRG